MALKDFEVTSADWDQFDWESIEEIRGRNRMRKVMKYIPPDGLHLDVGTGRGDGTYLVSQKKRTIGIDFGRRSLKIAAKKNKNLIQANACILPFKSGIFESITCLDVMEHIPEAEKATSEICRVLKPGGLLIMQTPTVGLNNLKAMASKINSPFYIAKYFFNKFRHRKSTANTRQYSQPYDKVMPIQRIRNMLLFSNLTITAEKAINYWHPNPVIRIFSFSKLFICVKSNQRYGTK